MSEMMCLAIKQPWTWAIFNAGKNIENRDWPTRFRGRIAILASKGMTQGEYDEGCYFISRKEPEIAIPSYDSMVRGHIIGTVDITDCGKFHDNKWFVGTYGMLLSSPVKFITPIPARGRLGIFPLEASIADQVEEERRRVLQAAHEVDAALKRAVGN